MSYVKIGIDLDNTLIDYSKIIINLAQDKGWIADDTIGNKKEIRDLIRRLPDGEKKWINLQSQLYEDFVQDADVFDGALDFIKASQKQNIRIFIISHKTQYAEFGTRQKDLRYAALSWLHSKGFLETRTTGLDESRVFFESTRHEKIQRILQVECTYFVDDLAEVLEDKSFPKSVVRILFQQIETPKTIKDYKVCFTWQDIQKEIFERV